MAIIYFSFCCGEEANSFFVERDLCPRCRDHTEFEEIDLDEEINMEYTAAWCKGNIAGSIPEE
jgi:hypothetical protein